MNAMRKLLSFFAVLALTGCVTDSFGRQPSSTAEAGSIYACRNGDRVSALYGSQGKAARITVGGVTVQVDPVQAPFGEKFRADDGTTFWVNGQDVLLEWQDGAMLFCREEHR